MLAIRRHLSTAMLDSITIPMPVELVRRGQGFASAASYAFSRLSRSWSSLSQVTGSLFPSRSIRRLALG